MYSTYFKEYILDDAMLKRLQEELFKILLDIDYVCKKHDIKYMLCGGTLIGAIRHKGFIPWDDDIDLMMIRSGTLSIYSVVLDVVLLCLLGIVAFSLIRYQRSINASVYASLPTNLNVFAFLS